MTYAAKYAQLLNVFLERKPLTLQEIETNYGWSRSAFFRFLRTARESGIRIVHDSKTKAYQLAPGVVDTQYFFGKCEAEEARLIRQLAELIKAHGLKKIEVAQLIDMDYHKLVLALGGKHSVRLKDFLQIADVIGYTVSITKK